MPYVRETSISFFGVCGYNKLIKFNEENFRFADVSVMIQLHVAEGSPDGTYKVV